MAQGLKDTAQTVTAGPSHHHRFYQSRLTNVRGIDRRILFAYGASLISAPILARCRAGFPA